MRAISDLMASLSQLTADGVARDIRKTAEDPPRVSVLDVIGAITGLDSGNSSNYYNRLREQFPEVSSLCSLFKFPGKANVTLQSRARRGWSPSSCSCRDGLRLMFASRLRRPLFAT